MTTAAIWRRRVRAWRGSGLSAREFAEGKDFAEATLRWWAWRLRGGDARAEAGREAAVAGAPRLLRVIPRREGSRPDDDGERRVAATVTVEIGRARVSVPAGVDRATLREVLAALDAIERERGR